MKNNIITHEEMVELTGYEKPSKQCEALENAGIFFIRRLDGYPKTTWEHFNNPLGKRNKTTQEEPNFEAM
ncbi:DUF4224 domain-containing protein [Photorhabdus sp. APURE]|uniref:DUF4224 domain-containing protein n=1 Tax=Photorhabdus aballayi TaxID=2991723 RepID=UPI00223CB2EC|nr:DUF4224 domain-containing protein [Photorhabdus aballayi]MCW7549238.1 DUF4224 domain-containing protein [Photorhabdus aballayi]